MTRTHANAPHGPSTTTPRVLFVDDEPAMGDALRIALAGIRGRTVTLDVQTDAERAVRILENTPYDLVLSDYRMPKKDGIDVLRAARATHPQGYRILMTGYGEVARPIHEIRAAHIDAYIPKPIDLHSLRLILRDFVDELHDGIAEHRAHARHLENDGA